MNRIYALVWNRSSEQLVVASELATSGGDSKIERCRSMSGGPGASKLAAAIVPLLAAALGSVALLNPAPALADTCVQLEAQGDGTTAEGDADASTTCGAFSVAIGTNAYASADNAVAIGTNAIADAADAVAIGNGSTATGGRAVAIGAGNTANGNGAVAIGDPNTATGNGAIAQGLDNTATGDGAVAAGNTNMVGGGGQGISVPGTPAQGAVGIGYQNTATGVGVLAMGNDNTAGNMAGAFLNPGGTTGAVALGSGNTAGDSYIDRRCPTPGLLCRLYSAGNGAVAIGADNIATGAGSVALGFGSRANLGLTDRPTLLENIGPIAIGYQANANRGSIALGTNASGQQQSIAVGYTATSLLGGLAIGHRATSNRWSVVLGWDAIGQWNSVAMGQGAQADAVSIPVGGVSYTTSRSIAIGTNAVANMSVLSDSGGMVAIGNGATVRRTAGIALGNAANVSAPYGMALGVNASVSGTNGTAIGLDSVAAGESSIALGNGAQANGASSISIGTGNVVSGANSGAFGDPNIVSGTGSYAFGNDNTIANDNTFVLGNNVTTTQDNSVVLGNASTDRAATTVTGVTLNGTAYTYAGPGSAANGVVSVGAAGAERQLINVAAGEVGATSTDAINGSQLFATNQAVQTLGSGWTVTAQGANASNVGVNSATGTSIDLNNGDGNLVVSKDQASNDVTFDLADDIAVDSVTAGGTELDGTGLTIAGGPSVTLAGIDAGGLAITNVAPGVNPTDAVNVSQLEDATAAVQTHYYSVNDNGVIGGNYANDGATGVNALAAGVDAAAAGEASVAIGFGATADHAGSIALGAGSATAAAVGTAGVVLDGQAYGFAGSAPIGTVSVGTVGGERTITNVAAGRIAADSTDAVNGSQLFATNQALEALSDSVSSAATRYYSVNSTGGGNEANDGATGADAIAAGKDAEADGDEAVAMGLGATAAGDGGLAVGAGAQAMALNSMAFGAGAMATHANSIALGAGSATTVGAQSGYAGAFVGASNSTGELNIGGRQVTGVAAGSAGTDAVNVDQLQGGVDSAVATSNEYTDTQIGNINTTINNLDNRLTSVEGDITDIQGDITDIQGDITEIDDRVTSVEGDINDLSTTVNTFDDRVGAIENGSSGMFQVSQDINTPAPAPTGLNSAAGGAGASASGDNALAVGNGSTASGDGGTALGNGAAASGAGSTAIGFGAQATHDNSVALGEGSATTVGAQNDYDAAYVGSSDSTGEVNMGGRTITGVAPGIAGTDAVNVNQLDASVDYAVQQANEYTDNRIQQFESDIWMMNDDLRRDVHAAVASAMAVKQAPWVPGKTSYYVGVAAYRDQGAVGISMRRTADNGRWSLEGGFTSNRDGQGAYIGVSGVLGD